MEERRLVELSGREKQLVQLAASGHTDASIAHQLGISEATVSTYWGRVRIKVGPFSRPELIAKIMRDEFEAALEDLRKQNEELVESLHTMEGSHWESPESATCRNLIIEAPDGIIIVTSDGSIEVANDEAGRMFGYERSELEGQNIDMLVPPASRMQHRRHVEEYVESPTKRQMAEHSATDGLRKDGALLPIAASLSEVETAAGPRVMCIVRPVEIGRKR